MFHRNHGQLEESRGESSPLADRRRDAESLSSQTPISPRGLALPAFASPIPAARKCDAETPKSQLPRLYPVFPRDGSKGNTEIDIIAVHGIETCSPTTWTAYERDTEPRGREINWLVDEDMLPRVVPLARIWVFDYNSRYSSDAQVIAIKDLGAVFLRFLWDMRDGLGARPIIFIGSCFGGIVITQALQRAEYESSKYGQLLRSTKGVIFLGTPLRGTKVKDAAEWKNFVWGIIGKGHEASITLIQDLGENSGNLESLVEDFGLLVTKYELEIRCFYETRTTQILNAVLNRKISAYLPFSEVMLVEKTSACLDCHEHIPLEARHAMMNKYRGPHDGNFKLVSGRIREIFQKIRDVQHRTKEQIECLHALSSNYREYKDANPSRVPGTCQWLLEHRMFLKWRQGGSENLLWVSADPGCGKSVLSRALVDERLVIPHEPTVGTYSICYFFFKVGDAKRSSGADALCAILHQLFTQRPGLLKHAMTDFENHGIKVCGMFGTLWDILMTAIADREAGQVICVLDALDECEESARKALIQKLSRFCLTGRGTKAKLKFLVTSRPYADIKGAFGSVRDLPSINLKGEDESAAISKEIDRFIIDQVAGIARSHDPPISEEVKGDLEEHLKKMENRTYLWLHLILDEVRRSLESSQRQLRKLLEKIPPSVDAAYEGILNRVTEPKARTLLQVVVSAKRPLTLREANVILAIREKQEGGEKDENYYSESDLDLDPPDAFRTKVRNLCGLFISIIDSKVYLIHQTAREFLTYEHSIDKHSSPAKVDAGTWKHSLAIEDSNLLMAEVCISYLLLCAFGASPPKKATTTINSINHEVAGRYGGGQDFLDYAAKNWTAHFQGAKIRKENVLLKSLELCNTHSKRFQKWFRVYWTTTGSQYPQGFTDLMVGSHFGLEAVVQLLLQAKADVNAEAHNGRTALHLAAENGHETVVHLLLGANAGVDAKAKGGWTALLCAAGNGHKGVVRLLLTAKADVNAKTRNEWTALQQASKNGHEAVVQQLLEAGAVVNLTTNHGWTVLQQAAKNGHEAVVQLLLAAQADVSAKTEYGRTALQWAAIRGHTAVVAQLLKAKSNVNAEDSNGETALHQAAKNGRDVVAKLLIEAGANVNAKNDNGTTALHQAAKNGHEEVVQLLMEKKADTNATTKSRWTALWWAAENGHEAVVRLLLKAKADVNTKDKNRRTALQQAAKNGHETVVHLLLEAKADVDAKDNNGETALQWAAKKGHKSVMMLLRESKADTNAKDTNEVEV